MIRLLLPTLLYLFLISICSGQIPDFKVGLNVSTITSPGGENKYQSGFYAGVSAFKKINESVNFKAELIYSRQGAKSSLNERARYDYLNMPLLISTDLGKSFYLDLGVLTGIIFNATVDNGDDKVNVTSELSTIDFAICSGIGYSLNNSIRLETRLNYGLTNSVRIPVPDGNCRNIVFQIGLVLDFKKKNDEAE